MKGLIKKMKKKKGFTLIELLVVIAIIGLLSTLAVVSLNSARQKARDAKRLSDIKQISTSIELAATADAAGSYLATFTNAACNEATERLNATGCVSGEYDLTKFVDPQNNSTACDNGVTPPCTYALSTTPAAGSYEICFALETAQQGLAVGLNKIIQGGIMSPLCN
jgi:prepilin-type N-terminal cleavage/methylation domain-containing protein